VLPGGFVKIRHYGLPAVSAHASFYVREAAARLLAEHPHAELAGVAEALAHDRHPQVARSGMMALSAVKRTARSS